MTHHHHHHHHHHHAAVSHQTAPLPTQTYLRGIDVSHWDGHVDWNKVKASGVDFAFAKATDGHKYTDPTFSTNWAQMKAVGLVRGAYHFGHPKHDAVAQAQRFFNVVKPTYGDLPLVLDLETNDGQKPAAVWAWTQAFIAEIERLSDRPCILYTSVRIWLHEVGNPKDDLGCPLWVVTYGPKPHVPAAWTDWTFWQYTEKGTVAGIHGHVDQNYFQGTLGQLYQLARPYRRCEVKDWY